MEKFVKCFVLFTVRYTNQSPMHRTNSNPKAHIHVYNVCENNEKMKLMEL